LTDPAALKEAIANARDQHQAMIGMVAGVTALASREQVAPHVTVQPATIHNHLPEPRHEIHNHLPDQPAAVVQVTVPETVVHVENIVPAQISMAPIVNITNDVQPAPVTINNSHPAKAVQTVQRDANDEIVSTTTLYQNHQE
jgi:hypothetical protein